MSITNEVRRKNDTVPRKILCELWCSPRHWTWRSYIAEAKWQRPLATKRKPGEFHRLTSWSAIQGPGPQRLNTDNSVGSYRLRNRSSRLRIRYEFVWAFVAHIVDGHSVDADEDKAHYIEVYGSPVILDDHVRVSR